MKNFISKLFLVLMITQSSNVVACVRTKSTPGQWALSAEKVYIGRVSSISFPELEESKMKEVHNELQLTMANRVVRIKVYETLKGKEEDVIEVNLGFCQGGLAKLREMVVVYGKGNRWHAKSSAEAIVETRTTLTKVSN